MRVFITGATGYIGSHVARALDDAGHDVVALAHHDDARRGLAAAGYEVAEGDLVAGDLPVVGDGANRGPLVHVRDLARLYVAALENAPAGSILHGVSETVRRRDIGAHLGAEAIPLDAARESMGAFAEALALDQHITAPRTRELLDWEPRGPGILELPREALAGADK